MAIKHNHLMIRATISKPPTSQSECEKWLSDFVKKIGMEIAIDPRARYINTVGNRGMTAIVGIQTSHIAFHVWDEPADPLLQFDLYTCGSLVPEEVFSEIKTYFGVISGTYAFVDRSDFFNLLGTNTIPFD